MPGPTSRERDPAVDWGAIDDLPVEEVRDVFLALTRTLRARQLYDATNPGYLRFLEGLRATLRTLWERTDRLHVLVQEDRLLWSGEEVYRNETRSDSLAFLLYRDGVRDLAFSPGVEETEIERFVEALAKVRSQRDVGEELATLLWDLDPAFLRYSAVDVGMDGLDVELPAAGVPTPGGLGAVAEELRGEVGAAPSDEASGSEQPGGAPSEPAGVIRKEEFNPTLHALDEAERRRVAEELRLELERDVRRDTITALLDILEEAPEEGRQVEALEILRTLLPTLLSQGDLSSAALLVGEVRTLQESGGLKGEAGEGVRSLFAELSSPESVAELVRGMEEGAAVDSAQALGELLGALGPGALEPLVRAAESALDSEVREVLREAMLQVGRIAPAAVLSLLSSGDPVVASGAVRLAGRMRLEEAAAPLAELMEGGAPGLRMAVVEASAELRSPVLAGALQRTLRDPERELRVAAARVLGAMGYPPAARELRSILEDRSFRQADVSEKVAFFEAYGRIAGAEALGYLDGVLNGRGFLGRREPAEIRAGAALGLGRVGSAEARAALERARSDEDPVVRSAVGRALRGGEER